MRPGDLVRLAAGALLERRTRSILTVVGILIGTAMIVALIASSQGQTRAIAESLQKLGPTTLVAVTEGATGARFTDAEVREVQRIGGVAHAYAVWSGTGTVRRGGEEVRVRIVGIDPAALPVVVPDVAVAQGAAPSLNDLSRALLGASVAAPPARDRPVAAAGQVVQLVVMVPESGPQGQRLVEARRGFLVGGVLATFGSAPFLDVDNIVFLTPRAAQQLLRITDANQLIVLATSTAEVPGVQSRLQQRYGDGATVFSGLQIARLVESIFVGIGVILTSIGAISLLVAGVGIANTMFVTVLERTREIGLMKALGFRSRSVLGVLVLEALLTGLLGGTLGCLGGAGLAYAIGGLLNPANFAQDVEPPEGGFGGSGLSPGSSAALEVTPIFSPALFLGALLFALAVSAFAGLLPARKAARMDPVVALRSL